MANPEEGPFPWWHVPGECHNSAPVRQKHEPRRAEYWSLAHNGYWFAECAECCARTRAVGVGCPDLAPVQITTARAA